MATKFINKLTGTVMWVDDSRAEEYKKLGYKPAENKKTVSLQPVKAEQKVEAPAEPIVVKNTGKPSKAAKKVTRKK